jgi:hypothetical protein
MPGWIIGIQRPTASSLYNQGRVADNTVYMILPDKHGRLWLSTNKGLSCFDTAAKHLPTMTQTMALSIQNSIRLSACADKKALCISAAGWHRLFSPGFIYAKVFSRLLLYVSGFKLHDKLQP